MATRHELIHIDFVANAGKANPVLKSLQEACEDARAAKESLDSQLKNAKASNASADFISKLETDLKKQTTIWQQLDKGVREYTKGIDTLSKGIKEFNSGTLDEMSAKFNKAVYNSAKLAQSSVKTGSEDWNQLQRLMDATDRNVVRAREDIDLLMKSIQEGSSVSTVQLTRARDVLQDLSRLAVTNSDEWRGLQAQMKQVDQAVVEVTETERRLKGEITTVDDAMRLSNALTKESINLRHADGEAAMKEAQQARSSKEEVVRGIQKTMVLRSKEREDLKDEISLQENLDNLIKKRDQKIADATSRKQDAEQRRAEAQQTIDAYEEQKKKVNELKKQKEELEKLQKKATKTTKESTDATTDQSASLEKQTNKVNKLRTEVDNLETKIAGLNANPIKPKVDSSEVLKLKKDLESIQSQIAQKSEQITKEEGFVNRGGGSEHWKDILASVQGSKEGRLNPIGYGEDKKQLDDILDVANNFYNIIKEIKGETKDGFFSLSAEEPIKRLQEYYKITEEQARQLIRTISEVDVTQKKYSIRFDERFGLDQIGIQQIQGKDDQQIRIEAAQEYKKKAEDFEQRQTEKVNKLKEERNSLEEQETDIKNRLASATEKVATATNSHTEATDKSVKLTKKQQEKINGLEKDIKDLDSVIEEARKQRDALSSSQEKGAEAAKKDAEAVKEEAQAVQMTAEQAQAALDKMNEKSTLKINTSGSLEGSNLEGAQASLMGIFKNAGASVDKETGRYTLQGKKQIKDAINAFKTKYGIEDDKYAKELMQKLASEKGGGLIKKGSIEVDPISGEQWFQITRNNEAWKERLKVQQQYRDIIGGVVTETKAQTAADRAQETQIKLLREAYQKEADALAKRKEEYQKRVNEANAIGGPTEKNGKLTDRGEKLEKAEKYKEQYVDKQEAKAKEAWDKLQEAKAGSIKEETTATEENTKAQKENVDVEAERAKIDQLISGLEEQKKQKTEELAETKRKATKATKEQTAADSEAVSSEQNMSDLLRKKEEMETKLAEKKKLLQQAQDELNKMTEKSAEETQKSTSADKEQINVTEELTKKTEEYNAELAKIAPMKEAKEQAVKDKSRANRAITNAVSDIDEARSQNLEGERKSEAEVNQMKQRVAELTKEIDQQTQAYNENAQAIARLNKQETDAAIEMAQSENVSIEKVKQAIALLEKKIQTEATDEETMRSRGEAINRLKDRLIEMNAEVAKLSQPIADKLKVDDEGFMKMSETEIRQAIEAANQLVKTYETGSTEAQELTNNIVRADKYLREHSLEAARQAQQEQEQLDLMTTRMSSLGNLSNAAFAETKKFWQTMYDGADRNDPKLKEIEERLKTINAEEQKRNNEQFKNDAARLKTEDLSTVSEQELQGSIRAAKQLAQAMDPADEAYKELISDIIRAEEHVDKFGLAGETNAQKSAQQLQQMTDRIGNLSSLSDAALQETKKFWEAQVAGTEKGNAKLAEYEGNLKKIREAEQERIKTANEQKAKIVQTGTLDIYSEAEIRESINAAKELQSQMKSASPEANKLAESIAKAESHIKKYGVEAARAAQKQKESDEMMREQLSLMSEDMLHRRIMPSASVLKAQQSYWKKLIEDPKTAKESLRQYRDALAEVEKMMADLVKINGETAFEWFSRGDDKRSPANKVKEMADKLKAYRDTLLPDDSKMEKIDNYLQRIGASAKKAAEDVMSLDDALKLAKGAGQEGFLASPQQIQAATKALNERRDAVIKLIQQNKVLGKSTEKEEAELVDLTKKLRDLKFEQDNLNMSQEKMRTLIAQPLNAVNLDELKAAIKRADAELHRMEGSLGENSKEYKAFAEQVKNAKNVLKEMEGQAKATSGAWEKAWSRLKTYVGMYMGFNMLWSKVTGTMGDLMTLSDKMGEVRKTTGFTADEVGRLSENLAKLDTRTPIEQLLSISARGGQLGLKSQQDIQGFTEAANQLMVALPEMGEESATELMKIAKATGDLKRNNEDVRETLERVGSTIIALRANSASTAPAITDFVKRVGAVGAQAGISIDQVAALGSTVDALGGRVEMSATALSRMIPAIRNNSFEVANAIGITEAQLKNMSGIEQMVTIFRKLRDSVKGFDMTTEEGMNGAAEAVESMLGRSTSMQDVMKQLNQQGARAGIVFGLLSQNVDELEKQLNTASNAYRKNIALANEYANMNETTAAKWEKIKNQIEEFFVSDNVQRKLGKIIELLRIVVNFITEDGPIYSFFRYSLIYFGLFKAKWAEAIGFAIISLGNYARGLFTTTAATEEAATATTWATTSTTAYGEAAEVSAKKTNIFSKAWGKLNAAMKANIISAVALALVYLYNVISDSIKATKEEAAEIGRFNQQIADEKKALDNLFEPLKKSNIAQEERLKLINEINSKYSSYLGYMLSETSSAIALADAHALIAKRIREEALERRLAEQENKVREKHDEDLNTAYGGIESAVRGGARGNADVQAIADMFKRYVDNNMEKIIESGNSLPKGFADEVNGMTERLILDGKLTRDGANEARTALYKYLDEAKAQAIEMKNATQNVRSDLRGIQSAIKVDLANNINTLISNVANSVSNAVKQVQNKQQQQQSPYLQRPDSQQKGSTSWVAPWQGGDRKTTPEQQMAPRGWKPNINKKDITVVRQFVQNQEALRGALEAGGEQINEAQRKVAESWLLTDEQLKEYKKIVEKADRRTTNPYGNYDKVKSPYSEWNGNDLVKRRKEMLERVKALANGADVQAVLSEDAAFISKAVRKNIKTTEQAIEWYNTERLKIQDALHAKHLTNTGDWKDPKKGSKRARKIIDDEMKYYMDELDAYYTERKAKIQEAQNDEEISEAEAKNRTLANEAEWRQRRAELQQLYAKKSEEVTKEEQDAIFNILSERTGESVGFIQKDIAQTIKFIEKIGLISKAAMDRILGDLDKGIETEFLRQRNAIGKHMKAIQDIVDKERPFNGITKNLETNLTTMGILTAHMNKERDELMAKNADMTKFNEKQSEEAFKELSFFLKESENAYSSTTEEVMQRAADAGLTAWVDYMKQNPEMQEGLMALLRSTFDSVQDAIKKEASQLKKQAEIMWNNILMPDGQTTLKQAFDRAISELGIAEGRVSRANSLIGAGAASERVADKLAIKQIQVQMSMQRAYYALVQKRGQAQVDILRKQSEEYRLQGELEKAKRKAQDADNAQKALNLAITKEETEQLKLQEQLAAKVEESQARLYKDLKEWGELLSSSLQSIFEADSAGLSDYYNERAKLNLTGKGGPGAGTYIIIENEGTSDAKAHYEYLDERQALERQLEIEQENAKAEAWKKVWDDINNKMNDLITDRLNAMLQNASIDANTRELEKLQTKLDEDQSVLDINTQAIKTQTSATDRLTGSVNTLAEKIDGKVNGNSSGGNTGSSGKSIPAGGEAESRIDFANDAMGQEAPTVIGESRADFANISMEGYDPNIEEQANTEAMQQFTQAMMDKMDATSGEKSVDIGEEKSNWYAGSGDGELSPYAQQQIDESNKVTETITNNADKQAQVTKEANQKEKTSTQSTYAAMASAMNMYGLAYQTMSNENMDMTQKFQMFALQAAGQTAIGMLTTNMLATNAQGKIELPGILGKAASQLGPIAGPIAFAAMTALLGGLMAVAMSSATKAKSQISQVTGASVNAGRMATGMLTYAEGNVNEFTDPSTLTPGRHYNVDGADGRTYRAKYMGKNAKTHITTGPEFHLVGEKGREAIIDAHTTRNIQMNDPEIWRTIQKAYNGASISRLRNARMGRGVRAFADGNLDDFEEMGSDMNMTNTGMNPEYLAAFQASIDKNNVLLERALANGIHAKFDVYGKGGLVDSYDTGKKNVTRHGEAY